MSSKRHRGKTDDYSYVVAENLKLKEKIERLEREKKQRNKENYVKSNNFHKNRGGRWAGNRQLSAVRKELIAERKKNQILKEHVPQSSTHVPKIEGNNIHGNFIIQLSSNTPGSLDSNTSTASRFHGHSSSSPQRSHIHYDNHKNTRASQVSTSNYKDLRNYLNDKRIPQRRYYPQKKNRKQNYSNKSSASRDADDQKKNDHDLMWFP